MILDTKGNAEASGSSVYRVPTVDSPPAYRSSRSALIDDASDAEARSSSNEAKLALNRRRRRRRIILFVLAVIIYSAALIVFVVKKPWKRHWKSAAFSPPLQPYTIPYIPPIINNGNGGNASSGGNSNDGGGPEHIGAAVLTCNNWDFRSPESSRLQSFFPMNTTLIFLNNMAGSYVTGTLYVWTAPEGSRKPGYHVQVEARARFKKHGVQVDKNINICILGGGPFGSYGLGIYDQHDTNHPDDLEININVIVPHNTVLPDFCTYLPRFHQVIGKTGKGGPTLALSTASLGGPVEKLTINSGEARKLAIRTGHSFYGSLTVSESLSITASEAASIVANVTLVHRGHPFDVTLATSHAPIDSMIRITNLPTHTTNSSNALSPFSPASEPIHCNISTISSHAPITLAVSYPYTSPGVVLGINAATQLAPLLVQVPLAFEGTFDFDARYSDADIIEPAVPSVLTIPSSNKSESPEKLERLVTLAPGSRNTSSKLSGMVGWVAAEAGEPEEAVLASIAEAKRGGRLLGVTQSAKALLDLKDPSALFKDAEEDWWDGCLVNG